MYHSSSIVYDIPYLLTYIPKLENTFFINAHDRKKNSQITSQIASAAAN